MTIAEGYRRLGRNDPRDRPVRTETPVADLQRVAAEWVRTHGITVRTCDRLQPRASACRADRSITVRCWPVETEEDLYEVAHECGHLLAQPCTNLPPHYSDPAYTRTRWHVCVACELAATKQALWLGQAVWTRRIHRELARCLRTYRATPTWPAQVRELDAVASDLEFYRVKQNYVRFGSIANCRDTLNATMRR